MREIIINATQQKVFESLKFIENQEKFKSGQSPPPRGKRNTKELMEQLD